MSYETNRDNYPLQSRDICRLTKTDKTGYFSRNMKTFREALLDVVEKTGISLKKIAEGSNVSYEQLKKLKQNKSRSTNVDDARKIAAFFGKSLDDFIDGAITEEEVELASLLKQLDPASRDFLLKAARAQIADERQTPQSTISTDE